MFHYFALFLYFFLALFAIIQNIWFQFIFIQVKENLSKVLLPQNIYAAALFMLFDFFSSHWWSIFFVLDWFSTIQYAIGLTHAYFGLPLICMILCYIFCRPFIGPSDWHSGPWLHHVMPPELSYYVTNISSYFWFAITCCLLLHIVTANTNSFFC